MKLYKIWNCTKTSETVEAYPQVPSPSKMLSPSQSPLSLLVWKSESIRRHFSIYNMKLKRFEAEIINKLTSNSFSTRSPLGPKRGWGAGTACWVNAKTHPNILKYSWCPKIFLNFSKLLYPIGRCLCQTYPDIEKSSYFSKFIFWYVNVKTCPDVLKYFWCSKLGIWSERQEKPR